MTAEAVAEPSHILVVDDDKRLRELLRKYLSEQGFRVTVAADAGDARRRLDGLAFDLIVLDIMMPGENGLELTRALREKDGVPILLLTAMGEPEDRIAGAVEEIRRELEEQLQKFREQGKLLEAQRLNARTRFDLEMLMEVGHCPGIENYSRPLSGRPPGAAPYTLYDFFPEDFLLVIDESHVTVPQVRAMYAGDRSRKETLVEHGFRLPSDADVFRPLRFDFDVAGARGAHYLEVIGRLRPGLTEDRAKASLEVLGRQLSAEYPEKNEHNGIEMRPLQSTIAAPVKRPLLVLAGAVAVVSRAERRKVGTAERR